MSNDRSSGGPPRRRGAPSESAVQEKLARIRQRRAQRQAARAATPPAPKRQPAAPAAADDDEGEATQAFNIADFDLDGIGGPAPRTAAAAPAAVPVDDDDEGEATQAFNIADFDLDGIGGPAARPPAAPTAAAEEDDDGDDERTAAFSIDDMGELLAEPAPAGPAREVATSAPGDDDDDDDSERTAAFSIDDLGGLLDEPPAPTAGAAGDGDDDDDDGDERTAAISLDEMGDLLGGPGDADAGDATMDLGGLPEEAERTMMVDVEMVDLVDHPAPSPEPEPEPEPPQLIVVSGADAGKRAEIVEDVTLIGRGLDADFVIADASASRRHFNIVKTSSGWKLVDLGSGNGTKVDGQRVQELALRDGMTIECGTTVMRWEAPDSTGGAAPTLAMRDFGDDDDDADKTRMGDMAALEIDPDWENRRARQLVEAQQDVETAARPVPDPAAIPPQGPPQKRGGAGKTIGLIAGLVLLAGGGFVAADKFAGLGIIFDKAPTTTTSAPEGGDGAEDEAKAKAKRDAVARVAEAEVAYGEQRWHEARKLFKEALALDPKVERDNGDPVDESLLQVDAQLAAQNALLDAKKALQDERPGDALAKLKTVRMDTSYYKEAKDLTLQARDLFVAQQLDVARVAEDKGDYDAAKAAVSAALKASKDDPDALAVKVALERATAPDADNLETDDEDPAKRVQPVKVPKVNMAEGFSLYAKGNFIGAVDFFDGIQFGRASRRDKAKAKAVAGAITKFDTVFKSGKAQLEAGDPAKALNNLRQARKYDAAVNGAFRKRIDGELAKAYAMQAKTAFAKKQLSAAGGHAQRALKLDPSNADAKTIAEQVRSTALGWINKAKSLASDNPDMAMSLLSKAINALPSSDPKYQEGYKLLNQLAKEEDE